MGEKSDTAYPLPAFHFRVSCGDWKADFSEVSGLNIEHQVIEYRHGANKDFGSIKMPGIPKYGNITLKRGIIAEDNDFYVWLGKTEMNKPERRDLTISLLNEGGKPVMNWEATQAFPVKIEGPGLKSTGNEVAIESVEVAHEGLKITLGA